MGLLGVNGQREELGEERGGWAEGAGHFAPRFYTRFHSRVSSAHTFQWVLRKPPTPSLTWVHRRLDYLVTVLLRVSPGTLSQAEAMHKNLEDKKGPQSLPRASLTPDYKLVQTTLLHRAGETPDGPSPPRGGGCM